MTEPSTPSSPQDYDALAITALVKQINDEYAIIRASERRNLPKAIAIGEKLLDLRPRVSKHGEWQDWLKKHCPSLAYETATGYIRLADNQDELAELAKAKSVADADLTISEALKLLAKPKPTSKAKNKNARQADVQEPDTKAKDKPPTEKEIIQNLAPDELLATLKEFWDMDQLRELSRLLQAHVSTTSMVRRPLGQSAPPPT